MEGALGARGPAFGLYEASEQATRSKTESDAQSETYFRGSFEALGEDEAESGSQWQAKCRSKRRLTGAACEAFLRSI